MAALARILMFVGGGILLAGFILLLVDRLGYFPFRIPGNIRLQLGNATCVIALGASIFFSLLLTLILNLLARFLNK